MVSAMGVGELWGQAWGQQSISRGLCNIPKAGHVVLAFLKERMLCPCFGVMYSTLFSVIVSTLRGEVRQAQMTRNGVALGIVEELPLGKCVLYVVSTRCLLRV